MRLLVARHTESEYNVNKLLNADPSVQVHITKKGREQALQLAEKLAGEHFEVIYRSELPRTAETAAFITQVSDVPVLIDKRLNDNDTGYEGRPVQEYMEVFKASSDRWNERFGTGESLVDARSRVEEFLNELKQTAHESVLIVTHGFIIECIYGILTDTTFEYASVFDIPQGDFTVFEL